MKRGFLRVVMGLTLSAACSPPGTDGPPTDAPADEMNPFFTESTLPYAVPPFDRIDEGLFPDRAKGFSELRRVLRYARWSRRARSDTQSYAT